MTDVPPLYGFQKTMVQFLVNRNQAFMAADMGLGKTRVSIEASQLRGLHRMLVVAPAIGMVSWPSELEKWVPGVRVQCVSDPDLLSAAPNTTRQQWAVVPFSEIQRAPKKWVEACRRYDAEGTIIDEAHYAKEPDSARAQALYGWRMDLNNAICSKEGVTWPMSGTPAPNYTSELWTHLRALSPNSIMSPRNRAPMGQQEFRERFSVMRYSAYGEHVTGSKNTMLLRKMTEGFFHRVRKHDVTPDLPRIQWTYEPIPVSGALGLDIPEGLDDAGLVAHLNNAYPSGSAERKAVGLAKVPGVVEWARAFLSGSDRKLIIFGWHRDVVRAIHAALGPEFGSVAIDGDTTLSARAMAVKEFQTGPSRVFVGQMLACGTMLTLTAASDVAFAEDDWTDGTMRQAAARADRLGQTRGVRAVVLHSPTRKDRRIAKVRVDKEAGVGLMFDPPTTETGEPS